MISECSCANATRASVSARGHREGGTALLVAMMMLVLMGMIGLASLDTVMRDRQVAGHTSQSRQALYAAEAGIAQGLQIVRTASLGTAIAPGECLSQAIPITSLANGSSFRRDTTADGPGADPDLNVCMLATAEPCQLGGVGEGGSSVEQGQQIFLKTVWDLRLEGRSQGGAVSRVQATVNRCRAYN
jgi:hypothetical protein